MLQTMRAARAPRWTVALSTLAVWALAVASVAGWGLRAVSVGAEPASAAPVLRQPAPPDPAAIARLLGAPAAAAAEPAAPSLASRLALTGVVAGTTGAGAALISVDGAPPRPYAVGSAVDGLVLQSVQGRRAQLGPARQGPATLTLELPPLPQ